MHVVTDTHISLKHTAPKGEPGPDPRAVAAYVAEVIADARSDEFTTSESGKAYADAIRSALGPGWAVARRGEYLYGWRRDVFRRRIGRPLRRVRMTRTRGAADWRNLFVLKARMLHLKSQRNWAREVGHMPATVQDGRRWRASSSQAVGTHQAGTRRWGAQVKRGLRLWPKTIRVVTYDSNLDHRLDVWRDHMTAEFGMPSIWSAKTATKGTHPRVHPTRVIDAGNTNADVIDTWRSPIRPPAYVDHWAINTRLHF